MFLYCTYWKNQFSWLFIAYSSHQSYCSKAGLGRCIWAEEWHRESSRRGAWKGLCQAFAFCLIILLILLQSMHFGLFNCCVDFALEHVESFDW